MMERMFRFHRLFLLGPSVAACLFAQTPPAIDNDQVRALTAHDEPHVKHALHEHKLNRVMVYLTAGEQDIITQDGKKTTLKFKPGDVGRFAVDTRKICLFDPVTERLIA